MPPRGLSARDIEGLTLWPDEIPHSDLASFFDLDVDDLRWLRSHSMAANQLGLGVQLSGLRYLGFIPDELRAAPAAAIERLRERRKAWEGRSIQGLSKRVTHPSDPPRAPNACFMSVAPVALERRHAAQSKPKRSDLPRFATLPVIISFNVSQRKRSQLGNVRPRPRRQQHLRS